MAADLSATFSVAIYVKDVWLNLFWLNCHRMGFPGVLVCKFYLFDASIKNAVYGTYYYFVM